MRSATVVLALLLLILLASSAQGSRRSNIEEKTVPRVGASFISSLDDGHCSGKGRKLPSKPMTPLKKPKVVKKDRAALELEDLHTEHYPEVLDIAEMDYSPAKRKPPIHN